MRIFPSVGAPATLAALAVVVAGACTACTGTTTPGGGGAAGTGGAGGPAATLAYGDAPEQVADLWVPDGAAGSGRPWPVVVLVHGGYWRAGFDRSLESSLAVDLVRDGYAVWNVDYRGVGAGDPASEGGWPATFDDVAAATDLLPRALDEAGVARGTVAVVGHSAGGALALWLAARGSLPDGAPGASPVVVPDLVVSQAGVDDLTEAAEQGAGGGAVEDLMGGTPAAVGDRYDLADPARLVPLGVPTLVVTGADDTTVPPGLTTAYGEAARAAGDDVTVEVVPGEEHLDQLDPASRSWRRTREWLDARVVSPRPRDPSRSRSSPRAGRP